MQTNPVRFAVTIAVLALGSLVGWAQSSEQTHNITVDDYLSVHLITDCATSPDGKKVAFVELRWGDHDKPRSTDLWVVDTQTPRPLRLTFDPVNDRSPQWAPDGRHLYFVTQRDRGDERPPYDGTNQVWVIGTHPAEPFPITRVKDGVSAYQLAKNGRALYYTKSGKEAPQEWEELRDKYSDITFGHGTVEYTELWKLNLETWRETRVLAPDEIIADFSVSNDESRIALITMPDDRLITREGESTVKVYDVATEKLTAIPDHLYREDAPSPFGWVENLAWSSDGEALAWTVSFDGYPAEILVANPVDDGWTTMQLKRPDEVHVTGQLRWVPGTKDLCFLAEHRALRRVYCITGVGNGSQGSSHIKTPGNVVVHGYSFSDNSRQLAVVRSDTKNSRDVYWIDANKRDAEWTRLTRINPQMNTWKLPQVSHVTWTSTDGTEIGGILELPPGYKPDDGPLPLVVEVHGGPTACTLLHLRYWIYGRTILAAKGYALLSPNYRGSTGYGDKLLTDLIGHENDRDVKDILSGVDALIERGIADPDRLGVMGWSNGGFLTNCLIVTTTRFKAASSGAGTIDQVMQWGLEDTPGHVINYMRGLPWERTEAYMKASPAYRLGQVTTPTIIHVGAKDARVPAAHSRTLYRALKDYTDVPTCLLVYPGAGHGLQISDHRKAKLEWDIAWLDRYLLGNVPEEE